MQRPLRKQMRKSMRLKFVSVLAPIPCHDLQHLPPVNLCSNPTAKSSPFFHVFLKNASFCSDFRAFILKNPSFCIACNHPQNSQFLQCFSACSSKVPVFCSVFSAIILKNPSFCSVFSAIILKNPSFCSSFSAIILKNPSFCSVSNVV